MDVDAPGGISIMSIAHEKWRGKSCAEVKDHAAQEVWPFLADFCNLQKVFPRVDKCYVVEGVAGEPGVVRYCAGFPSNDDKSTIKWAKERLVMIDPSKMCISYEIIDSNMGFNSYVATMQVVPKSDDEGSSMIEWSFVSDPNEGGKMEDVQCYGESSLASIAKKIEHVLASCNLN